MGETSRGWPKKTDLPHRYDQDTARHHLRHGRAPPGGHRRPHAARFRVDANVGKRRSPTKRRLRAPTAPKAASCDRPAAAAVRPRLLESNRKSAAPASSSLTRRSARHPARVHQPCADRRQGGHRERPHRQLSVIDIKVCSSTAATTRSIVGDVVPNGGFDRHAQGARAGRSRPAGADHENRSPDAEESFGDILPTSRPSRHVTGIDSRSGLQVVRALVPLAETSATRPSYVRSRRAGQPQHGV